MGAINLMLDGLLVVLMLLLALRAVLVASLYQSAITFIAFGLTLSLAWARLAAPDVALAEAAIGAGLLGVLLIHSLRDFESTDEAHVASGRITSNLMTKLSIPIVSVIVGMAVFAACLLLAVKAMPAGGGLTGASADALERSGVAHPVTAVLLNYRSYDTWLEIGVLVIAMLAIFCAGGYEGFRYSNQRSGKDMLIGRLARLLAPLMVLVAGYLLWLGKSYPGGAFQAGVVLGAAGIILQMSGWHFVEAMPEWLWKIGLAIGFAFFLFAGVGFMFMGLAFLEYPVAHAGWLILLVETLATVSIGLTLTCFYVYFTGLRTDSAPASDLSREEGGRYGDI
jgi:multisubunit Na+/H+ antiporter MnhB subunit